MKKFIITISILSLITAPALAVHWKNIFDISSSEGAIQAYIDAHRIKTRNVKGEKLMTFWLKLNVNNQKGTAKAISHYEVNCNTKDAFYLERNLELTNNQKQASVIDSQENTQITGKDYNDIKNILDKVCNGDY